MEALAFGENCPQLRIFGASSIDISWLNYTEALERIGIARGTTL
jgi:hypothetical protein